MKKIMALLFAAVMAGAVLADAKIKHPSLLFTPDRVEAARNAVKSDTVMASAWHKILAEADAQLVKGDVRKLEYPALAFQMTGDKRYADKIREVLLKTPR